MVAAGFNPRVGDATPVDARVETRGYLETVRDRLTTTAGALLLTLGLWYVLGGAYTLAFGTDWDVSGVDLSQRWREQRYVLDGQNPMTAAAAWFGGDDSRIDPAIGVPGNGGYPPWAYAAGAIFMWGDDWDVTRRLWAAVNLLSAGVIGLWAWSELRPHNSALLASGSALAIGGGQTAVAYGQWTMPVVAAAAGALWLSRTPTTRRGFAAGTLLAVALTKVTLTGPFAVPFLLRRRWLTLAAMSLYLAAATLLVCWRVGTPPWTMLAQMAGAGATYAHRGYDAAGLLMFLGVPSSAALKLAAAAVLALAAALHWRGRHQPLLFHFAVAAVAARLWTYHKGYDNPVLIFLLIALLAGGTRATWAAFWVVGLSLWLPPAVSSHAAVQVGQVVVWVAGLAALALSFRHTVKP